MARYEHLGIYRKAYGLTNILAVRHRYLLRNTNRLQKENEE